MTRTEEVDAAIERSLDVERLELNGNAEQARTDRILLAHEVVLLREAVRGLQAEKEDLLAHIRELTVLADGNTVLVPTLVPAPEFGPGAEE